MAQRPLLNSIAEACDNIAFAAEALESRAETAKRERDAIDLARVAVSLKDSEKALEEALKRLKRVQLQVEVTDIPELFESRGVKSIPLDDWGVTVTRSNRTKASVKSGQKEAAFEWLREQGLGDMITENVNANSLAALAKDLIENGMDMPEDVFHVFIQPSVSIRKKS